MVDIGWVLVTFHLWHLQSERVGLRTGNGRVRRSGFGGTLYRQMEYLQLLSIPT